MQIRTEIPFQTFNDGVCRICLTENAGGKGNMPVYVLKEKAGRVPFERRTVGIKRYYEAKKEDAEVELLIRIPAAFDVSTKDICMIGGEQYGIQQVQEVRDVMPQAKDITLKRMEETYGSAGI